MTKSERHQGPVQNNAYFTQKTGHKENVGSAAHPPGEFAKENNARRENGDAVPFADRHERGM